MAPLQMELVSETPIFPLIRLQEESVNVFLISHGVDWQAVITYSSDLSFLDIARN